MVCALLMLATLLACQPPEPEPFSIHLLADEVPAAELSTCDLSKLELQEPPIVSDNDIISYWQATHEIELTAEAYERIQELYDLPVRVSGMPFVVSVGRERIYAGAFWTPLSSLSFDGVVIIQPLDPSKRSITIELGYPSPQAFAGPDPRSDQRILRSLQAKGKLEQ